MGELIGRTRRSAEAVVRVAGLVANDRGNMKLTCPCLHRGRGITGTMYGINLCNGDVIGVGTEEEYSSRRRT